MTYDSAKAAAIAITSARENSLCHFVTFNWQPDTCWQIQLSGNPRDYDDFEERFIDTLPSFGI